MEQKIVDWLEAGAIWRDGVLLFRAAFGRQHPFLKLIKRGGTEFKYQVLKQSLSYYANALQSKRNSRPPSAVKLRDEYPFLNDANCPPEFKILVADKLTAYYAYMDAYQNFFDCHTNDDYLATATQVVENYIKNRLIHKELDYYKKHNTVLGQHPIFKLTKRVEQFKKMKIAELIKLKQKLLHNIWRINSEINKADKPHLLNKRKADIDFKQQEIIAIDRILEPYV